MAITPFQLRIPDEELTLLNQKLKLARIPTTKHAGNSDDNGITSSWLQDTVNYWVNTYDWRAEEAEINKLPQFTTPIEVSGGQGTLNIHFVHSKSSKSDAIPLVFLHGWPGSIIEVTKGLQRLNDEGFHVVAPSLPGYFFSEYPKKDGFNLRHVAEVAQKLMVRLGYHKFLVQGGDWGAHISKLIGKDFPDNVLAVHTNMFEMGHDQPFAKGQEPEYSDFEKAALKRGFEWFRGTNSAYSLTHATKPNTIGFAMHDSPVGMLAWMYDKLVLWTDAYPWTPREVITWTLLHYFVGPTTSMYMYRDNYDLLVKNEWFKDKIDIPFGVSAFPKELMAMPRSWVAKEVDLRFYREHARGGHFAMYEQPEELVDDMVEFYRSVLGS